MSFIKKTGFFFMFLFATLLLNAQIINPVTWTFSSKKTGDAEAEIIFTAKIDKGWHLYSQDIPPNGPLATTFDIRSESVV